MINLEEFISVKGEKALGNKLTSKKVKEINLLDALPYAEPIEIIESESEIIEEKNTEILKGEVVEVSTEIELNITNDIPSKNDDEDEGNTAGQITLEL